MVNARFAQVVDAHYASLYRFALSLVENTNDAADLVQQTFLIWARKGATLRDDGKAKAWLFTTLYREYLRVRRRDARALPLADFPDGAYDTSHEEVDQARSADVAEVAAALHQVDEPFRVPLMLYYLDDLTYQEIADTLDLPIGTVMSRLSRGKARVRAVLSDGKSAAKPSNFTNHERRGPA